jgi:hypothetical protein
MPEASCRALDLIPYQAGASDTALASVSSLASGRKDAVTSEVARLAPRLGRPRLAGVPRRLPPDGSFRAAHESIVVTVHPRAPLDRSDQALSAGWMLLARLATDLAVVAEAHARGTPPKDEK